MKVLEQIPESHRYLLADETKAYAFVAASMPNGGPQLTAVWFITDGRHILFSTTDGAAKYRYFTQNPRIAVAIFDPHNPNVYFQLRGTVQVTEEGGVELTHALARKYTGADFTIRPGTRRIKYAVTPQRLTVWPPASWG